MCRADMGAGSVERVECTPPRGVGSLWSGLDAILKELSREKHGGEGVGRWLRFEATLAVKNLPVLDVARQQGSWCDERFYLRGRELDVEVCGLGFAKTWEQMGCLEEASMGCGITTYVASRFNGEQDSADWEGFGSPSFLFIPVVELRNERFLAVNVDREREDWRSWTEQFLRRTMAASLDSKAVMPWRSPPGRMSLDWSQEGWTKGVGFIKDAFEAGTCSKVVLARTLRFSYSEDPPDAFGLLPLMDALTPGCYLFALQPRSGKTFFGCSPEQLFCLNGSNVETESLAGTRRVQEGRREEAERELLASEKDRYEHGIVSGHISSAIVTCGGQVSEGDAHVVHLPHLVHLRKRFHARLPHRPVPSNVKMLLATLNPTPAVCGTPTVVARKILRGLEPFDRGYYSGPLGYVSDTKSEFCVAIRSALVSGRDVIVFAGAGIVPSSDPDAEWRETALKMTPLARLLAPSDTDSLDHISTPLSEAAYSPHGQDETCCD